MRILILGAAGFIGRQLLAELLAGGHEVIGAVRRPAEAKRAFPTVPFVACDLSLDLDASEWGSRLAGVDILVNVAGVFGGPGSHAVHVAGPKAIYEAARAAGVRRIILISAISARPDVDDEYADTKLLGERAAMESRLEWTILRPSLVVAKGSYGGTSLIRGLAAFPFLTPLPPYHSEVSPIHARDLARIVRLACETDRIVGCVLEPVGPQSLSVSALILRYRQWLGFPPIPAVTVPHALVRIATRIGDVLGRGPISTTGLALLKAGNRGDVAPLFEATGYMPRSLEAVLVEEPADVQDRWHARLFLLRPLVRASLVLTWFVSGVVGLAFGHDAAGQLASGLGLPVMSATPLMVAFSVLDLAVAVLLFLDRLRNATLAAQILLILGYTIGVGYAMPDLIVDPFGALLKNLSILALALVDAAIRETR